MKRFFHPTGWLVLLCFTTVLSAQTSPVNVRFGKISKEDLALISAPGDPTAEAYVLHNSLSVKLELNVDNRPVLLEDHHRRVKLLTDASFDRSDIQLKYFTESESIIDIRAEIHFPDGSSEKVSKKDIIRETFDDEYDVFKFTFPGVRQGAILEYSYRKRDENILIPSRYFFQEDIPVRYAEYKSVIPFMFDYVSLANSRYQYAYEHNKITNNPYGSNTVRHNNIHWVMTDLPAYDDQPYTNNLSDYLPQVRHQLRSVSYVGQPTQKVFTDWAQSTRKMYEWVSFGRAFNNKVNSNKAFREVEPLLAGATTDTERAYVIYNFVTGRITWNGTYSWLSDRTPNKVYEAAMGDSGEMSILLLALLKQADIDAEPVLVPLRDRGAPIEIHPLMTQFDHLMVLATLDGKSLLLDPNGPRRPMGLPRAAALNYRLFLASEENPHWFSVKGQKATQIVQAGMTLDQAGMATVDLTSRLGGYFALEGRTAITEMEEDSEFPLMEAILGLYPDADLVSKSVKNERAYNAPLDFEMQLNVPIAQAVDDYLYVQPVLCHVFEKNLADTEQRIYPVDFAFPFQRRYIATLNVPEGYAIEELPKTQRVVSADGTVSCTFSCQQQPDKSILVRFDVDIENTFFPSSQYEALRDMFRVIIGAQESTLVFKRDQLTQEGGKR